MGMHVGERIEVETFLTIKMYNMSERALPPLQVRIIHANEQANRTWNVGAEFIQPLSDQESPFVLR
jgi:hypothetical protein